MTTLPERLPPSILVDLLAQEIRRVDGSHSLGAAALAEALMPFLAAQSLQAAPEGWVAVSDRLPELRDDGVLAYFSRTDAVETVHIEDYFRPITAGLDDDGNQKYALWATSQGVTHWMPLPAAPSPTAALQAGEV